MVPFPSDSELLCYAHQYKDLFDAFGTDLTKLAQHWARYGSAEGRIIDPCILPSKQPANATLMISADPWRQLSQDLYCASRPNMPTTHG